MSNVTIDLLKNVADRLKKSVREAPLDAEWDHLPPPIGLTIGWIQMNDDGTSNTLIAVQMRLSTRTRRVGAKRTSEPGQHCLGCLLLEFNLWKRYSDSRRLAR